ncbi:peptidoglycan-binding protein [Lentzea aerocolonigenes]|uniref:peptidoglycan-binding protein n=1 Tax=Lentzea aerocolonigenes TaxID=68170 RepID=UPI0004C36450|nr:peptidoglycan-binding protein [Lentzea aerocolonigenes]MCP2248294.1 putative peptidoglycan binding domain-containing protein [Lentzea aerocolonigenes]
MTEEAGPSAARRRRRKRAVWIAVVLAFAGTAGAVTFTRLVSAPASSAPPVAPPATTQVTRTTLTDRIKVDGDLGTGTPVAVTGRRPGTLTRLPAAGEQLERGKVLYEVNAVEVPVFFGGTPLYREMRNGVPDGDDVKMLQENLLALGYSELGAASGKFGPRTAAAVKRWQKSLKAEQTGVVQPGDVIVVAGPVRVHAVTAQPGAPAEGPLLTVTGLDRLVSVELTEAQRRLARVDAKVKVYLPGGKDTPGTVREVAVKTVEDKSKPVATVTLDDAAPAEPGRVTVEFDGEKRENVLAVPVQALLAVREGGYAVEVVEGGKSRYLAVRTGMFAGGMVEITGDGLTEGMTVVTTS